MKKQEKIKFKIIIKGIIMGVIITMSLFHSAFPDTSDDLIAHKSIYKAIIQERENKEAQLLDQLLSKQITKEQYAKAFEKHKREIKQKLKECNNEKRKLAYAFTFNGRNSFHYWLFIFGLSFSFFVLSLRYSYKIALQTKGKYLKRSVALEAISWTAISLFWVSHTVFRKTDDLPSIVYIMIVLSICIVISFSVFYLFRHSINKKYYKLKTYKASIVNLIELISDIRVNHYFHMAAKAINPKNENIIVKDSEIMDEKIFNTLEKVADGKE